MIRLLSLVCITLFAVEALAKVRFTWPYWDFKTAPFRPPKFEITKSEHEATEPGLLFIGLKHNQVHDMLPAGNAGTIYDQDGNLVWHGPHVELTNLRVQTLFGQPVLTYWSGKPINGYGYGAVHILDQTYKEIYTVKLEGNFRTPDGAPANSYIDLHESKITDRNTMLVTAYNLTKADINVNSKKPRDVRWVIDPQFYEIDIQTNKVLFSWSTLDHQDRLPISSSKLDSWGRGDAQYNPWDMYHINSVDAADSGYLVSLRHTFSAVYVNTDGSIRWLIDGATGGDFELEPDCQYAWQHDIRLFDETPDSLTMTIFNNAATPDYKLKNFTTGLVLGVDLHNMTITNKRTLIDRDDMLHAETQGSLQVFGGNTSSNVLMDYGAWATLKEYNAMGRTIYTAKFGPDAQIASYRGAKFEWHATPYWMPKAHVAHLFTSGSGSDGGNQDPYSKNVIVYTSWNGATDYDHWAIYGGDSVDIFDRQLLALTKRTGFESETKLINVTAKYIQAVPMQDGRSLTHSTIVDVPSFS